MNGNEKHNGAEEEEKRKKKIGKETAMEERRSGREMESALGRGWRVVREGIYV